MLVLCNASNFRTALYIADSGISRPKELSGKRYASYGARYEGRIVQQMIKNDGGDGEYIEDTSMGMLGIWKTLLAGKADATWVFMGWEGVMAKQGGVELNVFQLDDYKVFFPRQMLHFDVQLQQYTRSTLTGILYSVCTDCDATVCIPCAVTLLFPDIFPSDVPHCIKVS